jgi:hypothetical protein
VDYYILDGHTPVRVEDFREWAVWCDTADRRVAQDYVGKEGRGKPWVSTVFLTMNHNWHGPSHPPVVFETMVFDCGELSEAMMRYSTWEEAEAGHQEMLEVVRAFLYRFQRYDALRLHDRYLRFPKPKRAPAWRPCSIL